jgi:hypothetical protein
MWCWSRRIIIIIFIHNNFICILINNLFDYFCFFRFNIILICHLGTSSSLSVVSKSDLILLNHIILTVLHSKLRNFILHSLLWILRPITTRPLSSLHIFLVIIIFLIIWIIYKLVLVVFISITISIIIIFFILIIVIIIRFNSDSYLLLN